VDGGRYAHRELRGGEGKAVWVCRMGREAVDGGFGDFQSAVKAVETSFDGLEARCATLRGDRLAFGWSGVFLVNGEEQSLSGFPHYDNPFTQAALPCKEMEIRTDSYLLRLNFGSEI
ncbi:MAG: hypothetical protein HY835_04920, partial [Anaerolineae bacterium]|nr:hypothetical protein [Anaerolineae bacterium]